MGLNLVIGCERCRERIWFYRGQLDGMERFYREHWPHSPDVYLGDDQGDRGERLMEYPDVGVKFGATGARDGF